MLNPVFYRDAPTSGEGQGPSRVYASRAQVQETGRNALVSGWQIGGLLVW